MQAPPGGTDLEVFLTIMLNTTPCNTSTCIDSLTCEGTRLQDPVGEVTGYWPLGCSVSTANVNRGGSCLFTPSPASDRESRGPGSRIDMEDCSACKIVLIARFDFAWKCEGSAKVIPALIKCLLTGKYMDLSYKDGAEMEDQGQHCLHSCM